MPSPAYFLRQADICMRLSLIASDEQVSNRLIVMAQEYKAKAEAVEKEPGSIAAEMIGEDDTPNGDAERN